MSMAVSDREFSKQVLARLHGMARTKICKSRRCETCKELPRERPATPTAENNVLLAMREERIRQELVRASLSAVVQVARVEAMPAPSPPVERERQMHRLPAAQGCQWGAAGNLLNHAFADGDSLCGKWPRSRTRFDLVGYHYCRACKEAMQ